MEPPTWTQDAFDMDSPAVGLDIAKKVIKSNWPKSVTADLGSTPETPTILTWEVVYKNPTIAARAKRYGHTDTVKVNAITLITQQDCLALTYEAYDPECKRIVGEICAAFRANHCYGTVKH